MEQRRTQGYSMRGGREADPDIQVDIDAIIVKGDVGKLVAEAQLIGKALAVQNLTTSQIRNVFGTVRQIQLRWDTDPERAYREAILLRPKMAYSAEREKQAKGKRSIGMDTLQKALDPALVLLGQALPKDRKAFFERFVDFFEAIVAYHKLSGGRD